MLTSRCFHTLRLLFAAQCLSMKVQLLQMQAFPLGKGLCWVHAAATCCRWACMDDTAAVSISLRAAITCMLLNLAGLAPVCRLRTRGGMWRSSIASAGARARSMRQTGAPRLAPLPCLALWLWLVSVHDVACVGMAGVPIDKATPTACSGLACSCNAVVQHGRARRGMACGMGVAWRGMAGHCGAQDMLHPSTHTFIPSHSS